MQLSILIVIIFVHMTSFSVIRNQALEQGQVMAALNIIVGNKSPNNETSNVRNGLKLGQICKKVILYTKM